MTLRKCVDGVYVDLLPAEEAALLAQWAAAESAPEPVRHAVSMCQIRLALIEVNLYTQFKAFLATLPEDEQVRWEFAERVERDSPHLAAFAASIGRTQAQVDALFRKAAKK